MSWQRFLTNVIAALYFGSLIGLTFVPTSELARSAWFVPFVAFVPVGVLLVLLMGVRRWWAAVGFSVLGSAWIEAAQSIWMPAGYAQFSDLVFSSLGAIVGVAATILVSLPARRSMRAHESPRIVPHASSRELP
ncbi:MAG: VanZ family protein [Rhodoglobus sp.]|nr:VanZ family protein [Rhodoglobus sp.]